jgi:hypothetical protein
VTDDVWLADEPEEPPAPAAGIVAEGSAARSDPEIGRHAVARPKAPEGADNGAAAKVQLPGPPPRPPKEPGRLWLAPWLKRLGRTLKKPLSKWAAVLLGLAAVGAAVAMTR